MPHPAHDAGLSARLRRLIDDTALAFCKLNRIQFEAPWRDRRTGC
jgi:hypothetical protein